MNAGRTIFVSNVNFEVTRQEFHNAFNSKFGPVERSKLLQIKKDSRLISRGCGFITFRDKDSYDKSIRARSIEIRGRTAYIKAARKPKFDTGYIYNIPDGVDDATVRRVFKNYHIKNLLLARNASGQFGFIQFETEQELSEALAAYRLIFKSTHLDGAILIMSKRPFKQRKTRKLHFKA